MAAATALLNKLLVKRLVVVQMGRDLLRLPLLHRRLHDASLEIDRE
jgi:hypothetical protein